MLHGSISRYHARVAFDGDGTPWLRDYGSAHGTYLNKRRLPPVCSGREESASGANESAKASHDLSQLAVELQETISWFKMNEKQGSGGRGSVVRV